MWPVLAVVEPADVLPNFFSDRLSSQEEAECESDGSHPVGPLAVAERRLSYIAQLVAENKDSHDPVERHQEGPVPKVPHRENQREVGPEHEQFEHFESSNVDDHLL